MTDSELLPSFPTLSLIPSDFMGTPTETHKMPAFKKYKSWIYLFALWTPASTFVPQVQADELWRNPDVQAAHLVGHEDALLLQRVQDVIDDWDPRRLVNPYLQPILPAPEPPVQTGTEQRTLPAVPRSRDILKRPDLAQFIANPEAAKLLGKLWFWDMQVGSDFGQIQDNTDASRNGQFIGTACASCHYRFGTDARDTHVARIPVVVWNKYQLGAPAGQQPSLGFGEQQREFDPLKSAIQKVPFAELDKNAPFSTVIGSQGVEPRNFSCLKPMSEGTRTWVEENSAPWCVKGEDGRQIIDEHTMFVSPERAVRQITPRNSPTVINACFADRLFSDGRAESTFNGFSIFGDIDKREVIHRRELQDDRRAIPVTIAIPHAALASQAVGPVLNEVEMSWKGRTWQHLAQKLLPAHPLKFQTVDPQDSVLGMWSPEWAGEGATKTYRDLIKIAFRREWWDGGDADESAPDRADVPLELSRDKETQHVPNGTLMEANFSLYWGLSLLMYQSTLISDQTPFDAMMVGNPEPVNERFRRENARGSFLNVFLDRKVINTTGTTGLEVHTSGASLFQHGLRAFLRSGCVECHSGPLFSEVYDRLPGQETAADERQFGIHYLIERALLPISRSDAVATKKLQYRREIDGAVESKLTAWNPHIRQIVARLVIEFDRLREDAAGDVSELEKSICMVLSQNSAGAVGNTGDTAQQIASMLMKFEKEFVSRFGERWFFTEEERVTLAKTLLAKLRVEFVRLSPEQAKVRPPLPIHGALSSRPYQFYDLGFYALGVSLPRYDRGNGGRNGGSAGSQYNFSQQMAISSGTTYIATTVDESWSGSGAPDNQRRANQHFVSRTRQAVMDESPSGFRKPLLHDNETAFWGAFKTPTLRNVELTAPYMHNGRFMTLRGVIEFYDRHGEDEDSLNVPRDRTDNPDMHPKIDSVELTESDKLALHFFLLSLTDERVHYEQGPFDHPSLLLVNGYQEHGGKLEEVIVDAMQKGTHPNGRLPETSPAKRFPNAY